MKTRSQTYIENYQLPPFVFDFDESSEAWHANKKKLANGCYQYICGTITKTGKKCMRKPCENEKCTLHK